MTAAATSTKKTHPAPSKTITSAKAKEFAGGGVQLYLTFDGSKGTFSCNAYKTPTGWKVPLGTDCQEVKKPKSEGFTDKLPDGLETAIVAAGYSIG